MMATRSPFQRQNTVYFRFACQGRIRRKPGRPTGRSARSALRQLVADETATDHCYKRDRYDREVCHAWVGGRDLGEALISNG